MNEAVLARLEGKLDALDAKLERMSARGRMLGELYEDMGPVAKQVMQVASTRLGELERRGYVDFGRELLAVLDAVVTGYTPEDVHQLADNVVRILDLVRRATQPEILDLAHKAAEAAEHAGESDPPGVIGMLRATSKDEEVRRGLMVVLDVLREIGKASHHARTGAGARINPLLGPKRNLAQARLPKSGGPRPWAPGASTDHSTPSTTSSPPASIELDGVALSEDGFVADPSQWTREIAATLADHLGVGELTARHWEVIDFARQEFASTGASPNVRRLTTGSGVPTRELYQLFPRAPAKTAARIAGIPKPVGCI